MKSIKDLTEEEYIRYQALAKISTTVSFCSLMGNNLTLNNLYVSVACWLIYTSSIITKNKLRKLRVENDPDLINLKEVYNYIINSLGKYAKNFDINNSIEAFIFLDYLYDSGALSYNHEFEKDFINGHPNEGILRKTMALNGHGVCRHLSPLLSDYLKEIGYQSDLLVGLLEKKYKVDDSILVSQLMEESEFTNLTDEQQEELKEIMKLSVSILNREILPNIKDYNKSEYKYGNHMITRCNDGFKTSYLDLTLGSIYIPEGDRLISNEGNIFTVREKTTKKSNSIYEYERIKVVDSYTPEDIRKISSNFYDRLDNNKDYVEEFYKENKDRLEVAEDSYRRIMKKRF